MFDFPLKSGKAGVTTDQVMVLHPQSREAFLIKSDGSHELVTCFKANPGFDGVLSKGCSVTWQNGMYIFGGEEWGSKLIQILQLDGFRLKQIGKLNFYFHYGGCSVSQQTIFLCFHMYDGKLCRQADRPLGNFIALPMTEHEHRATKISSSQSKFFSGS